MVSALQSSTAPLQLLQSAQVATASAPPASTTSATLPQDTVSISSAGRQMASSDVDSDGDSH